MGGLFYFSLEVKKMSLIKYQAHSAFIGWQRPVEDGQIAGTVGQARRMEAFRITELNIPNSNVNAKAHVQNIGWSDFNNIGQDVGSTGKELHMEAIIIGLTGEAYETHDIWYRVHAAGLGWMDWAKNGEMSGTVGGNIQAEAIQIIVKPKSEGFDPHVDTDQTFMDLTPQNPPPAPKVDLRAKLLEVARSQLFYRSYTEEDSEYGRQLYGEGSGNWCAWFVVWCCLTAGMNVPVLGSCPKIVEWAQATGRWTGTPEPGFWVLYDFNRNSTADHIGIVENVYASNHVLAIEGNTDKGDGVGVYEVDRSDGILGYINPF